MSLDNPAPSAQLEFVGDTSMSSIAVTLPGKSLASRSIPLRSKASSRGALVAYNRAIVSESEIERKQLLILLAAPETLDVIDQPSAVTFIREDGTSYEHTFDFLWRLKNGARYFVYSKPSAKVEKYGLDAEIALMRAQLDPALAHGVILMTEESFSERAAFDAELIHAARRRTDLHAERAIVEVLHGRTAPIKVGELISALNGTGATYFRPIIRLVAEGVLRAIDSARRLDHDTLVSLDAEAV